MWSIFIEKETKALTQNLSNRTQGLYCAEEMHVNKHPLCYSGNPSRRQYCGFKIAAHGVRDPDPNVFNTTGEAVQEKIAPNVTKVGNGMCRHVTYVFSSQCSAQWKITRCNTEHCMVPYTSTRQGVYDTTGDIIGNCLYLWITVRAYQDLWW